MTNEELLRNRDSMIAHRWFAQQFGEVMNGRDFAVKCPMASDRLTELRQERDEAIRERDQARDAHARTKAGWEHCRKAWNTESERLRDALEAVEWIYDGELGEDYCPACGATRRTKRHKPDCTTGAALDRPECRK